MAYPSNPPPSASAAASAQPSVGWKIQALRNFYSTLLAYLYKANEDQSEADYRSKI